MICELAIALVATLTAFVVIYFKRTYRYWDEKGVPYVEPRAPFGNAQNRFKQKQATYEMLRKHHVHFKSNGHKHGGIYIMTTRIYMPVDLDLIKRIFTKDFSHFTDHGLYYDEEHDPLNGHLFNLSGGKWRSTRNKITPTFTSEKMKKMFQTLLDCGEQLVEHVDSADQPLDFKDVLASFTTDVIGSCAFGIDCNSFREPHSEFREKGRMLFASNLTRKLRMVLIVAFPNVSKLLRVPLFERELTGFYFDVVKDVVKYREANDVKRGDYLDILLDLKNGGDFTLEELAAQAFGFIMAGFETTSTATTFCLFELGLNPDVQEKLRREIEAMLEKDDGRLIYDSVMRLPYMGQVIDETLRKYPPLPTIMRKCVKDYPIPGTDVVLEKDTRLFVSTLALHHDAEYYPDPERFDPERFTDENKARRHNYAFLPFGEGPRMCLGKRFAVMQMRLGLVLLLSKYRLTVSPRTELPLKMDPQQFLMIPKEKIWLVAERI